jgi:3',5'-nucleoside bisphosphate phosphatase
VQLYLAELHIHTVLSPCAEVEMIPPLIIQEALDKGIKIIAISDHNASANVPAVVKAAEGTNITVLPGIEVQTKEEVHVLCLFDTMEQLAGAQNFIDQHLPASLNDPEYFGEQFVVDETGEFVRREHQLLITSIDLSIDCVLAFVESLGGLAIPAHVDRQAFGLLANLGFIPHGVQIDAVEISRNTNASKAHERYPQIRGLPLIQSGDAHRLDEIIGANAFWIEEPTIAELRMAFRNENGRSMHVRTSKVDNTHSLM